MHMHAEKRIGAKYIIPTFIYRKRIIAGLGQQYLHRRGRKNMDSHTRRIELLQRTVHTDIQIREGQSA